MQTDQIHLEKITYDNVGEIVELRVAEEQKGFVASNDWSLIHAYLSLSEGKPVYPFGIYCGDTPVGFIMIDYDNAWEGYKHDAWLASDEYRFYRDKYYYYIWRFMIDERYQHRGYGREALRLALAFIKTFPCGQADYCVLSYEPTNEVARQFYRSFGLVELNQPGYYEEGEEISAVLEL